MSLSLGLSIPVSPSYLFDISVSGRKYKQTNGIKFYSELGVSKVYHLTGLGMHYNRFAGNNYSTYYNGYEWGGSLGVHTSRSTGFVGNVAYRYFSCEKIISSLNELPMARIGRHTFAGEWLYRKSLSGIESWGIKLTGNYELKLGTENIFVMRRTRFIRKLEKPNSIVVMHTDSPFRDSMKRFVEKGGIILYSHE